MKAHTLELLYEDAHIVVCVKPSGVPTQSKSISTPDMESLLKNHIYQQNPGKGEPYLAIVHRLDQPVKGILVFAKTPFAARELNKQLQNHGFGKYYRALVAGTPPLSEGVVTDYMAKDSRTNTSHICSKDTPGAKEAKLHYQVINSDVDNFRWDGWGRGFFEKPPSPTELEIHLDTGRHHQIRVQLAHMGCPILGDSKYNPQPLTDCKRPNLCLCAYKLNFLHPKTKKRIEFSIECG